MNQHGQGMGSLSSPDPPMKRKRGRPRKDENLASADSLTVMPGPDSLKKSKQSASTSDDVENEMVGQVVTGMIEGAFDAGYLLNVRVGDTDTKLRGVVFLQEKITPVTPANDIAPHIRMCKRREIPLPPLNPQSQRYESARPSEQSNRQPVDVKPQIPTVPNQTQSSVLQSVIPESLDNKSFPPVVNLLKNDASSPLGRKVMPQPFPEPGTDSRSAPAMPKPKPKHNNVVELEKVLEEVDAAPIMEGPNGVEANKASKTETAAELGADVPGIEPVCKAPVIQTQAVDSEKSTSFADEVKSFGLELNQTPVFAEPSAMTVMPVGELNQTPASTEPRAISVMPVVETEVKVHQIQAPAVDSENEKSALGHDGAKSPNLELNQTPVFAEPASVAVITGIETLCKDSQIRPPDVGPENSSLVHDAVKSLDVELNRTPFAAPVTLPSESKIAAEGPIPLGTAEAQIPTSDGISSVECDVEDIIPPAQS